MSETKTQTLFAIEAEFRSITGLLPYYWMSKRLFPRKAYVRYLEYTVGVISQQYKQLLDIVSTGEEDEYTPLDDLDLNGTAGIN